MYQTIICNWKYLLCLEWYYDVEDPLLQYEQNFIIILIYYQAFDIGFKKSVKNPFLFSEIPHLWKLISCGLFC